MKLSELYRLVNLHHQPGRPHLDQDVVVRISMPYATIGGTPCIGVKQVSPGFDWDAGKFILITEEPLSIPDEKLQEQFRELQKKAGWLDYENRNLQAEIKRLRKGEQP